MDNVRDSAINLEAVEQRIADLESELAEARKIVASTANRPLSDTTATTPTQHTFEDSRNGFKQLVETSGAGIVVHKGWTPLYANQAYADLFGFDDPAEIIAGGTIETLFTPTSVECMLEYRAARLNGQDAPSEYEVKGVRKNGEKIWVRNTVGIIEIDGEQLIHCTAINTTQRNLAEQELRDTGMRFRTLFENVPISIREVNHANVKERIDALGITDHETFVRYLDENPKFVDDCVLLAKIENVNQACLDLHGATDKAEIVNQLQVNFSDRSRGIFGDVMTCIFDRKTDLSFDTVASRPDGTTRDVESRWSVIPGHEDTYARVLFISVDVTERLEIERMKNDFVSTVSHELRTPLTSIMGSLGLIKGGAVGTLPDRLKSMLDIAYSNSDRLVRLINDILDVQKIEAGKMEYRMAPLEIMALVNGAVSASDGLARERDIEIKVIESTPEAIIRGDDDRLMQVMTNLLSNAVKFSSCGASVEIGVSRQNGSLEIKICDRGPGIPEQFRHKIFEKFSRMNSSDGQQVGGTGLGLSISKSIVEQHGGDIGIEPDTGKGATFFFRLPEFR